MRKVVAETSPDAIVLPHAMGANISGVITTAILASIYISAVSGP